MRSWSFVEQFEEFEREIVIPTLKGLSINYETAARGGGFSPNDYCITLGPEEEEEEAVYSDQKKK